MTERALGDGAKVCDDKDCETCAEVRPASKSTSKSTSKKESK